MLVLTRRAGDTIRIGPDIVVTLNQIDGGKCSIGVAAPRGVSIVRGELAKNAADATTYAEPTPMFANTSCSQCGQSFGPGDHGFSHCSSHAGSRSIDEV